jgi:DNA-binding transcriptional ArsR family regulator
MNLSEQPDRQNLVLVEVLYALGDPVRLNMVRQLAIQGELPCAGLCMGVDGQIAKSTLSHHFRILRASGVISSRKKGTQWLNTLRQEDLETRFPGLLSAVLRDIQPPSEG